MKYKITIEETLTQDFEVEAPDLETAIKNAIDKYRNSEFALQPGNLVAKQLSVSDMQGKNILEWTAF